MPIGHSRRPHSNSGPQESFPELLLRRGFDSGVTCLPAAKTERCGRQLVVYRTIVQSSTPTAPFSPMTASSRPGKREKRAKKSGGDQTGLTGAVGEPGGARGGRKRKAIAPAVQELGGAPIGSTGKRKRARK